VADASGQPLGAVDRQTAMTPDPRASSRRRRPLERRGVRDPLAGRARAAFDTLPARRLEGSIPSTSFVVSSILEVDRPQTIAMGRLRISVGLPYTAVLDSAAL